MPSVNQVQRHASDNSNVIEINVFNVAKGFVQRHPAKVSLYVIGLVLMLFFQGFAITATQRQSYFQELTKLDSILDTKSNLEQQLDLAYLDYNQNRKYSFFFFEKCDTPICQSAKHHYLQMKQEIFATEKQEEQIRSNAKTKLGVLSEYGIDEIKTTFYSSLGFGKRFAKNQSKYDFIYSMIQSMFISSSRDEAFLVYVIRFIMTVVFNFTLGMVLALISFAYSLVSVLRSFQVGYIDGLFYFGMGLIAATSYIITWLAGFYLLTGGAIYLGIKAVGSTAARIANDPQMRQQYLQSQQRHRRF